MLLDEIEWAEPLLQPVKDAEWEAEIKRRGGQVTEADRRIAPNGWLREAFLAVLTYRPVHIPQRLFTLGAMVTAQENSCRYCYGANRAFMKLLGYSEALISKIERDMRVAELDEKEHAFIAFCRNLARSRPRPARAERQALIRLGYAPLAVNELAFMIATGCFTNRLGVLIACPPEVKLERIANGFLGRVIGFASPLVLAMLNRQAGKRVSDPAESTLKNGPFGSIVATLEGLPAGPRLKAALDGAFASDVLSRPAKAFMFAVVGRTLGCSHTEMEARKLLASSGIHDAEIETTLQSLHSRRLPPHEAGLLAWARDTVYYDTPSIQKQTRDLGKQIGDTAVLEAIGVAALANATVRLAMLLE